MTASTGEELGGVNRPAFLDMIAFSEGTFDQGDSGYNVLVGSAKRKQTLFYSYNAHPNVLVELKNKSGEVTVRSTAAGRYQLLYRYWKTYIVQLGLVGFFPKVQDKIALTQIAECRALGLIDAGRIEEAVTACRSRWASFPGAGYGQREHDMAPLLAAYASAGGQLA